MTTLTNAAPTSVRADGSSLLQQIVLSAEQSSFLRSDFKLLSRAAKTRRGIKVADVTIRSLIVLTLVTVGALVFTSNIDYFLALAIVIPLLFATDALRAVTGRISSKREVSLRDLQMFSTVASLAKSHAFNKTVEQKAKDYLAFLTTGKMVFSTETSHRILLEGSVETSHTISYVVG